MLLTSAPAFADKFTSPLTAPPVAQYNMYIRGVINDKMAIEFTDTLNSLNALGAINLVVHITSPGGEVFAGLQIYDAMMESSAVITTSCEGYCMSMAAILLATGKIREAGAMSTIMFHKVSSGTRGKLSEMRGELAGVQRLQNMLDLIISKHTGMSMVDVKKMGAYDHYMTADEAKVLGIIDHIRGKK